MNKCNITLLVLIAVFCSNLHGQLKNSVITGKISDVTSQEALIGAIVKVGKQGTTTDVEGNYKLRLEPGKYTITYSYIGFKPETKVLELKENDSLEINIALKDQSALDEVVVSAGRYEQKIGEVTISMEILKPALLENKNTTQLDVIMNQVPGVTVNDGQASIRGGSGFSYGAGSRVLMLVDEMPMLSADAGDIKWNYLPLENVEQIEVIKGAASSLYGSSALNGVIHLRTAYAKDKPLTHVSSFIGAYDAPRNTYKWWKGTSQMQRGINISHAEKIGNFDIVLGGHMFNDDGFRYLETENRGRLNANVRYNFKKIPGLIAGINTNMMNTKGGLFFLWQTYDSAYIPQGRNIQRYNNIRLNVDPYVTYIFGSNKLSVKTRYFKTNNINDKNQSSLGELFYNEEQYQRKFKNNFNLSLGYVFMKSVTLSDSLFGKHEGFNHAGYVQADKKFFDKLTVSFGARGEYYRIDTAKTVGTLFGYKIPFYPVFRVGASYQLKEYTFIRASFGQGYRFPSVAEKYVSTYVSLLHIFPNTSLQPEVGNNMELGIKQGFKIGEFKGFLDIAGFWTRYNNMVEFVFNYYGTDPNLSFVQKLDYYGFRSENLGKADIKGIDAGVNGTGKIGSLNITIMSGYTYMNPIKPDYDPIKDTLGLPGLNVLKYRSRHLFKNDIQFDYKAFSIGFSTRFQSKIENIDNRFVRPLFEEIGSGFDSDDAPTILPGLKQNFDQFQKNVWIHDMRVSVQITPALKLSYIVNNFTNVEYQSRPGDMRAPTLHMLQLSIRPKYKDK
ncbi:MAG: TonB-dependent receptor [Sphingobacteriaceae bacterium]|nr:TonB-dependent receptor [Sphingobacteriaceae bacterium]